MKKLALGLLAVLAFVLVPLANVEASHPDKVAARHAAITPWHGPYYHAWWGAPVPLVVPPTAHMQVNWGWGVSQSTMTPIYHQYGRYYPGHYEGDTSQLYATPAWPSHTSQFGVYYIRAPY
jgi:hypothetical protein